MPAESDVPSKPFQWWLEDAALRLVDRLAVCLSGRQAFRLGEWLGGMAWHLLPKRRRIVMRNLRIAMGGEARREVVEKKARECFRRTGANLVSVARTAQVSPERLPEVLRVRNPELMEQCLAEGKGVVLLLTHMGNWELLSRMSHLLPKGILGGAFYRPLNNPVLDARVLARREADGVRMFSKHDNFLKVSGFLRQGAVIGILADQRVGRQGEVVRFFGRVTRASPLPSLLARRARCPVLALSMVCVEPGVWEASYLPVDGAPTTEHCMQALETAMRRSLVDVFWFQERWRTYINRRRNIHHWLENHLSGSGMRHRAVVWAADEEEARSLLAEGWEHPDVDYEIICGVEPTAARRRLRELEWANPLPVDYVLTRRASRDFQKACKVESIPLVVAE